MASNLPYDSTHSPGPPGAAALPRSTMIVLAAFAAACLLSILAFPDAWWGMMQVWMNSETFTHGFIALPCAAWMIWRRRDDWNELPLRRWWPAAIAIAGCGALWLVGRLGGVDSIEQFAAVAIIPATLALLAGPAITRSLAFPLAFLFFAVPVGEFLTPMLMEHTADATIAALRWSGIPVYREGLHFMLPTGRWSVVEACSGLRYLIASVALGVLFAYLQFRTLKYRLAFMVLAAIVPILANWVRAYMIVMLGHMSDMRIAAGADHLIYGWLFFGLVMMLLFWIGARWNEPPPTQRKPERPGAEESAEQTTTTPAETSSPSPSLRPLFGGLLAAVVLVLVWRPLSAGLLDATQAVVVGAPLRAALAPFPEAPPLAFEPRYSGAHESLRLSRRVAGQPVEIYLSYYARQHETREMIHASNRIVDLSDRDWPIRSQGVQATMQGPVERYRIGPGDGHDLLLWHWYAVGNARTPSAYRAKAATAQSLLSGQGDHSVSVVLATPLGIESNALQAAHERLQTMATAIEPIVAAAARGKPLP